MPQPTNSPPSKPCTDHLDPDPIEALGKIYKGYAKDTPLGGVIADLENSTYEVFVQYQSPPDPLNTFSLYRSLSTAKISLELFIASVTRDSQGKHVVRAEDGMSVEFWTRPREEEGAVYAVSAWISRIES